MLVGPFQKVNLIIQHMKKWVVAESFQEYLYGNTFTSYSDNNPLTYVLTTTELDATGHKWIAKLAKFNFTVYY